MPNRWSRVLRGLTPRRRRYLDSVEYSVHPPNLTFLTDATPGRWVEERLTGPPASMGTLVPEGYAAYARVLHPARDASYNPVRWSTVAAWSGRIYHPLMSFQGVSSPGLGHGLGPRPWDRDPRNHGSLDKEVATELSALLERFTGTPEQSYFGVWEGYGQYSDGGTIMMTADGRGRPRRAPRDVKMAQRVRCMGWNYLLYEGSLQDLTGFYDNSLSQPPNIWWPADQAWFVASSVDLDSTYVGGSVECIANLLRHDALEAVSASRDSSVAMTADTINLGNQS